VVSKDLGSRIRTVVSWGLRYRVVGKVAVRPSRAAQDGLPGNSQWKTTSHLTTSDSLWSPVIQAESELTEGLPPKLTLWTAINIGQHWRGMMLT
jgi:hypothetical protein